MKQIKELGIEPIDLVIINLYPFKQTILKGNVALEEAIENIDIGGPTMLRAAAKNYKYVTVVVDPEDYQRVMDNMKANNGETTEDLRFFLAKKVFFLTSDYDRAIYDYLSKATH
jgi:phosphoribosylaminoimidazolecarboxamide formyltransferase/IMP cyclohydrolase